MATLEITIIPIGTGSTSASAFVAEALQVARTSGLKHELTAAGTILEGDIAALLEAARRMHESAFAGAQRVYTVIKIDDRRDKPSGIEYKTASVLRRLGEAPGEL